MRLARLALSLALLAVLALPGHASAFPSAEQAVAVEYEPGAAPIALMTGRLVVDATAHGALLVAEAVGTRIGPVPELVLASQEAGGQPRGEMHRDVVLIMHEGALLVRANATSVGVALRADYALGVGLPEAPFGGASSPGFLLAAEAIEGTVAFADDVADLIPLDAVVSLQRPDGTVVAGWDHRRVNTGLSAADFNGDGSGDARADGAGENDTTGVLRATGPFQGQLRARVVGASPGEGGEARLVTTRAEQTRFREAVAGLGALSGLAQGTASEGISELAPFAPILNGAVLLMEFDRDGQAPPRPVLSRIGDADVEMGGFALLRSEEMTVTWGAQATRIQGDAALAVTGQGLAVTAPLTLGPLPLVSALLWLVAVGAIGWFVTHRPEKPAEKFRTLRLASLAAHLVAFLLVFWWWDAQFANTFGTSFLGLLLDPASATDPQVLFVVLAFQLFPWGIAALLFALPVRIALGVLLRYQGKGTALRGIAKAGGLVALGVLGPWYALWVMNLVVERAIASFPTL